MHITEEIILLSDIYIYVHTHTLFMKTEEHQVHSVLNSVKALVHSVLIGHSVQSSILGHLTNIKQLFKRKMVFYLRHSLCPIKAGEELIHWPDVSCYPQVFTGQLKVNPSSAIQEYLSWDKLFSRFSCLRSLIPGIRSFLLDTGKTEAAL